MLGGDIADFQVRAGVAKTSAAIDVTFWYAAERDSAIGWSENKKEKISLSWMHNVCSISNWEPSNWQNLSIFLTVSKLRWIITTIITSFPCNTSRTQQLFVVIG